MIDPSQVSRRASPRRIFAPARARSSLAFLGALALVAGLVVALSSPAEAAITTPFTSRFSANTSGDILIRGNGLLTCPAAATGCAAAQGGGTGNNNDFSMVFVDVDSDPSTRSSSSAVVQLPGDATVLFAGLYWSAYSAGNPTAPPAGTARNRLLLQAPGDAAYRTITAAPSDVFVSPAAGSAYQSFADVTDIVAGAGGGTYTAGDIFAGQGTDRYGAWSLVVAISSPSMPVRNLTSSTASAPSSRTRRATDRSTSRYPASSRRRPARCAPGSARSSTRATAVSGAIRSRWSVKGGPRSR